MNKKKILSLALVVLLICTISFGTLAWFNATEEVTNTFYVADSDEDGAPDFSIDVTEKPNNGSGHGPGQGPGHGPGHGPGQGPGHGPGSEQGNGVMPDGENELGGYRYENILPGSILNKDAYVENTGDYAQWVRVHLIFSDAAVWEAAIEKAAAAERNPTMTPDEFAKNKLFTNLFSDGFNDIHFENNGDAFGDGTLTYTFYYTRKLEAGQEFKVLDSLVIPGVLEQADMNFGKDGFSLRIKAEAVQVENLDVDNAKAAFDKIGWEVGKAYGEQSGE